MPVPVFPQKREADFLAWSTDFLAKITATPTRFGLDAAQAAAYGTLHAAFASAYATAINPNTNSKANTEIKNNAEDAVMNGPGGARQLVNIIQAFPDMTDDYRAELNIRIPDNEPTPVPIPTERPHIDVVSVNAYTIKVRVHGDNVTGKPANVKGITLLTHVGPTQPADIGAWMFQKNTTKNVVDLTVPSTTPAGATVWITGFWFNNRMQSGPSTLPAVSINIPGVQNVAA